MPTRHVPFTSRHIVARFFVNHETGFLPRPFVQDDPWMSRRFVTASARVASGWPHTLPHAGPNVPVPCRCPAALPRTDRVSFHRFDFRALRKARSGVNGCHGRGKRPDVANFRFPIHRFRAGNGDVPVGYERGSRIRRDGSLRCLSPMLMARRRRASPLPISWMGSAPGTARRLRSNDRLPRRAYPATFPPVGR